MSEHVYDKYYECLKAIRRFEGLGDAVHPAHSDSVIIKCEVTAGDIRALLKCLQGDEWKEPPEASDADPNS